MRKIMLLVFFIGILFLIGCQSVQQECEKCPEEKALLTTIMDSYYVNELNEDRIFFRFSIINYGYKEAKNVEVACVLYDENDEIIMREQKNIGNIASLSEALKELSADNPDTPDDALMGPVCSVVECDDCEILTNRIPVFQELLKKYNIN